MNSGKALRFGLLAALIIAAAASMACNRSNGAPNTNNATATPSTIDVSTTAAVLRQLPRYFEATGSLAANQQTDVMPETSGKVAAVGVDLGSYVRRGQMIVKIDDADLRIRVQQ